MNNHPTGELTDEVLAAWPNCSVPDCEYKVTHDSDKCFPHTHGWEAVRENLRKQLKDAYEVFEFSGDMDEVKEAYADIAQCKLELEQIKNRK